MWGKDRCGVWNRISRFFSLDPELWVTYPGFMMIYPELHMAYPGFHAPPPSFDNIREVTGTVFAPHLLQRRSSSGVSNFPNPLSDVSVR
ncbi:hypothetical protein JNUCC1_00827 [Lentibacillus sp. JNUCC-1]|nr:hypothetical protein [Lentibacillus sp. JNUCC-1]